MSRGIRRYRSARRTQLLFGTRLKAGNAETAPLPPVFRAELLESRMLLSGSHGDDGQGLNNSSGPGPESYGLWAPVVPTPEQLDMRAQSVLDLTAVKVALHFNHPGYRVADWGLVKQDGNLFSVDAKVEMTTGPILDVIDPITLTHQYELGKLDPNAKYHFTFMAWGKEVETLFFSVDVQTPTVTIAARQTEVHEPNPFTDGPTPAVAVFISRTEPLLGRLDVSIKLAGAATVMEDYVIDTGLLGAATEGEPTDVVHASIPAGQEMTALLVIPLEDQLVEDPETVSLTLMESPAYKIGQPEAATITILDNTPQHPPIVTITATDPIATEPNPLLMGPMPWPNDPATFTLTRTGPLDHALMVELKLSGAADENHDFHLEYQYPIYWLIPLPPGKVVVYFPEGKATSFVNLIPHGDTLVEGNETATLTLVDADPYDVGAPDAATVTIHDWPVEQWIPYIPTPEQTDLAVNTLAGVSFAGVTLRFASPGYEVRDWGAVKRDGNTFLVDAKIEQWTGPVPMYVPPPVTHRYELGSLPPGEYSFTFMAWGQTVETLAFKIDGPAIPLVSIFAADPVASEPIRGGPQPRLGLFKLVRVGPVDSDLTVHLTLSGTANRPADFLFGAFDSGPYTSELDVMIPAGHAWVPIPVLARADAEVEGMETVILTVTASDIYNIGMNDTATVRILDTPSPIRRHWHNAGDHTDLPIPLPNGAEKLDLGDDELIVQLPENEPLADALAHITALVRAGRNGGDWTGPGITSTTAAADSRFGLAIFCDESANRIRVRRTWNGDANLDGLVNADDYFNIDSGFIARRTGWSNGDFNYDDTINADDYFLIDSAFIAQDGSATAAPPLAPASPLSAPTPKDPAPGISADLFSTAPLL